MADGYAVIIGGDLQHRERSIVCTARALGAPTVLLSYPGSRFAQRRRPGVGLADDAICGENLLDPERAVAAMIDFDRRTGKSAIAIVPVNDFGLVAGAALAQYAGTPFLSAEAIRNCTDKIAMKRALETAGLNVAKTLAVDEEVPRFVFSGDRPIIFKPSTFGGSGGVKKISNQTELIQAFDDAKVMLRRYRSILNLDPDRVHLEEYLQGEMEFSIEVNCTPNGNWAVAVTKKFLSPEPYFAEVGHKVPYSGPGHELIARTAEKACEALAVDRGVAHVEIKMVQGVPYVIEVGARPAGDRIIDLVYRALGVDLYGLHAKAYADQWTERHEPPQRKVAAISFLKAKPGRIVGIAEAELPQAVEEISIYRHVGEISADAIKDFEQREGHLVWVASEWGQIPADLIEETSRITGEIFQIEIPSPPRQTDIISSSNNLTIVET